MDVSELSLYATNDNMALKDYQKYLKFLCNTDGILVPNDNSKSVLNVLGIKYYTINEVQELFGQVILPNYEQNRNYRNAEDIVFTKAYMMLKKSMKSRVVKYLMKLLKVYTECKIKLFKIFRLKNKLNATRNFNTDINAVLDLLGEHFDKNKII